MTKYYNGNLDADLAWVSKEQFVGELARIGGIVGFGRAQQILQVLWAERLRARHDGTPLMGALLPEALEREVTIVINGENYSVPVEVSDLIDGLKTLQQDANRYRFLRDGARENMDNKLFVTHHDQADYYAPRCLTGDAVDKLVDEEIIRWAFANAWPHEDGFAGGLMGG